MELEKILISEERKDYKCFDLLRELLKNEEFAGMVKRGIEEGMISGFSTDVWTKIYNHNIGIYESYFDEDFKKGYNIGDCSKFSQRLCYSYDNLFCGGTLSWLKGTRNSPDGRHMWMVSRGYIYDTSLMLVIDERFAQEFGYIQMGKYDISKSAFYDATYDQIFDKEHQSRPKK